MYIQEKQEDFGSFLAAVMTLMMVEVRQVNDTADKEMLIPGRSIVGIRKNGDITSTARGPSYVIRH